MASVGMKRIVAFLLCALIAACFMLPITAHAQESEETVRVGWYESPFNHLDQYGRRSGYAYEYQHKISAYTGWNYEYVEGTWSELMQMLVDGEIDLMSDVSYKADRAESMLYSTLPMGAESYCVFIAASNSEIIPDDYASLDGKKVGVTKGSVQKDIFLDWASEHGVNVRLVELTTPEDESMQMVCNGELDAFITVDVYGNPENVVPVFKIGSSSFYFTVSKDRPDLLAELDVAMSKISDENKYYNQQLQEKYLTAIGANRYLSSEEQAWVASHGAIRVGYQDNYLAFCASDPKTGELTGALKDYLAYAATSMENAQLEFVAVSYPTAAEAVAAMQNGEVDCMFPANLTDYDSETLGVFMSPSLMRTEMLAVVRAADQKDFAYKENVTVAVNQGNPNYEMFLVDHFPDWQVVHYTDTPACLEAVSRGEADCILISNYRFNNIAEQCRNLQLTTVSTGVDMDYCFAVNEGDTQLYSILAKVTNAVPTSTVNSALTYYSAEEARVSFTDYIKNNLGIVMTVVAAVLLVILLLLLRSIRAEKKAKEEEHLVNDLSKRAFVDALTSVRNKGAFTDYVRQLQDRLDAGEQFEFAMGMFDCDDLKEINDQYGHDKGDIYLKTASQLICRIFEHSPVFRVGGDEFAVVLLNEDYQNREDLITQFGKEQKTISSSTKNEWERVNIAMGIAVYDPKTDQTVFDAVRRADETMYENKRIGKAARQRARASI